MLLDACRFICRCADAAILSSSPCPQRAGCLIADNPSLELAGRLIVESSTFDSSTAAVVRTESAHGTGLETRAPSASRFIDRRPLVPRIARGDDHG